MILQSIFLLIVGLVFGSFISALTWRYPLGISIAKGRSICPNCRKQIAWYDNIPLFSFILLGGKCRNCKKKISFRYPAIELSTALGFLLTLQGFPLQGVYSIYSLIFDLILFCVLEIIFIIDLEHQVIPDLFIFLGLFFLLFTVHGSLFANLLSGLLCASFLLVIHLLTKGRGMGLGDVKFAVLGGMLVGLPLSPVWLFVAFLTGASVGIILIIGKKAGLKSKIAFGPFLVIAIPITLVFGNTILRLMGLI
jgi:prepilin signal peptidase PulO-like enzyme (type II secretory pathway)